MATEPSSSGRTSSTKAAEPKEDNNLRKGGNGRKATRGKILKAAQKVFSQHPYNAASIRMIGKAAKVEHPLISYYFPSKAELFRATIEELESNRAELEKTWFDEIVRLPPARAFSVFLDKVVDYYRKYPELFRIVALNLAQTAENDPIPGFDLIQKSIEGTSRSFSEKIRIPAPFYEIQMFVWTITTLMVSYLGASSCYAAIMNLEPESFEYYNWVKETLVFNFLPRLEMLVSRNEENKDPR